MDDSRRTLQDQGGRYPAALSGRAGRAGGNPPFPELPLCVHERRTLAHFRVLEKQEGFDQVCGVKGWTLHDLRRTARSLMSRVGIDPDHAERCLGHKIKGVRGTYDRHAYQAEMLRAFEALAQQIDRIVNPTANVVQITGRG